METATTSTGVKLYIYDLNSGENWGSGGFEYSSSKIGIVSPNDNLTVSILERKYCYGDSWGGVKGFEMRDDDGGHKKLTLESTIDLDEETFMKIFGNKEVWDFFSQNQEVKNFKDLSFEVRDLMEELDETMVMDMNFNPKKLVMQFKGLSDEKLDALCQAIQSLKK